MKTRIFYTTGNRDIVEEEWDKPEITDNEIEVKSVYTGICRSDIDMYTGNFQLLPKYIQGHEGLGLVSKVGKNVKSIKEGDIVATRGEPAFSDFYNCKEKMFVSVPEISPKYILEPVACAVNIALSLEPKHKEEILIFGSGFLSTIVYTMIDRYYDNTIYIVGSANEHFWKSKLNVKMATVEEVSKKKFKHIIDISEKPQYLDLNCYAEFATLIVAAEKHPKVNTSFSNLLWNSVTVKFPSPRNPTFHDSMLLARNLLKEEKIHVDNLWTKGYDREIEVKLGFEEGLLRPQNYSRGYIKW